MPRYVLLEFEHNDAAKKFVERVNGRYGTTVNSERDFSVRAVWAIPTKYCVCARSSNKMWSFSRGVKSGWWLHSDCGRPSRAWATGVHWFAAIGRNILPGNDDVVPRGWGLPDPVNDPQTNDVSHIHDVGDNPPDERLHRKAEKRRNRKRKINPRRI